jgi:hypothetical protein
MAMSLRFGLINYASIGIVRLAIDNIVIINYS